MHDNNGPHYGKGKEYYMRHKMAQKLPIHSHWILPYQVNLIAVIPLTRVAYQVDYSDKYGSPLHH